MVGLFAATLICRVCIGRGDLLVIPIVGISPLKGAGTSVTHDRREKPAAIKGFNNDP